MLLYNSIANWNLVDLSLACSFPFRTTSKAAAYYRISAKSELYKWDTEVVPPPAPFTVFSQPATPTEL